MKRIFIPAFFLVFEMLHATPGFTQGAGEQVIKQTVTSLVLDDFEDQASINNWQGTIALSKEFPSHGKTGLVLSSAIGQTLWMETEKITRDWSNYTYLKFDIYNPSSHLYYGSIQIFDELGTDEQAEYQGQSYRGRKIVMTTGWNHYEFLIQSAMTEGGERKLKTDRIRKLHFSFGALKHPLFVDNLRLTPAIENPVTATQINPQDCKVIIDNRYVYPTLAGPIESTKTSEEVIRLRNEAVSAVDKLKREIQIAEMQGLQTLYQRIPLITAEVGLGIRSKLVWFQNTEEETKILKHIIKSCGDAAHEIGMLLSADYGNVLVNEPENDVINQVKYQSFYVPPYPSFSTLKPRDGFYRDEVGNPVLIFSMLLLNSGPLMDYFAPFNHRIESYSVGGGSRYDIESSPVYTAFHKDSATHRVGWDGWCGHLIKDRWAMGGKKEDVVICLENELIRQAVVDYMKLHYREWLGNENLLYNIMGYELQYICYCRKSQEMFRSWLASKYNNIGRLNQTWKTGYANFNAINAPETRNARPADTVNRAAWYDWTDFNTRRFTDYMKWVKKEMQKLDPSTPISAGGTSSMLNSANGVSGIDEEMIINEVDDVILNESAGSPIYSDLLTSLSEKKKVMVDPELGGNTHGLLLQFLHGKSDISKWWWANTPSAEHPHMNQSSLPHSKEISLADIEETLRIALDVRRLSSEIAEFSKVDPEVAILYSKTSILQVPPQQLHSGRTPYLQTLYSTWEGARFQGCRIGFVSETQILAGKLKKFKLLVVPAVKYTKPEIVEAIKKYMSEGGTVVIVPESFIFNQYAQESNLLQQLGISVTGVTLPAVLGKGEKVQNYDQSFSQAALYGSVEKKITTLPKDIFNNEPALTLVSKGLVQTIGPGNYTVLAKFEDDNPAIVHSRYGKGSLYYLAAPLEPKDYHLLLSALTKKIDLKRPVVGVDLKGKLVTGVEVRAVERDDDWLVYASNLLPEQVKFDLQVRGEPGVIQNLRNLKKLTNQHINLEPYQETIFRIEKVKNAAIKK